MQANIDTLKQQVHTIDCFTALMHITTRDVALQSNMHDKLVNTSCTQTTHTNVTTREALLSNTHSILQNTHAHSYIIRHRHVFVPSVARTCPSEGKLFPSPTFCSSIQEVLVYNCANSSKHRYTQTASTHACFNKGRGLVIKHALHIAQHTCPQTPCMHIRTRGMALQSNVHKRIVNTLRLNYPCWQRP